MVVRVDGNIFVKVPDDNNAIRWYDARPLFEFVQHGVDIDYLGKVTFLHSPDERVFCEQLLRDSGLHRLVQDHLYRFASLHEWAEIPNSGIIKPTKYSPWRFVINWDHPTWCSDFTYEFCLSMIGEDIDTVKVYNPVRIDIGTFERSLPPPVEDGYDELKQFAGRTEQEGMTLRFYRRR